MEPKTRYAPSGDARIAYQVTGAGSVDLVMVPGLISHLEVHWQWAAYRNFMVSLGRHCRLIRFDKRGTGLSDPADEPPDLDQRRRDLLAVMDDAGSTTAVLFGYSEGGPIAIKAAAENPSRVRALVLYGTSPKAPPDWAMARLRATVAQWGEGMTTDLFAVGEGAQTRQRIGALERQAASPGMARAVVEALARTDVSALLAHVDVPTLVLHREGDFIPVEYARLSAAEIPGARLLLLEGDQHMPWLGDWRAVSEPVTAFLDELATAGAAADRRAVPRRPRRDRAATGWQSITPAEMAVVRLAAEGLGNPEIAARLFLSRTTVETHLKRVFRKLGVESRAQLAAEFARDGGQQIT